MKHKVAGTTFQEGNLVFLAKENDDYSMSKKDLLEEFYDGDWIYRYDFNLVKNAKLKPEPENPHDPKAIAVYAQHPFTLEGVKIGYIKAGSTGRVNIEADYTVEIGGGPYKKIEEDGVENGRTNFWASIKEITQEEATSAPDAAVHVPEEEKPKKSKKTALLLCIFLGIFGAHKFYEGKAGIGILYLFTGGLMLVGWISDIFKILKYPDAF